MLNPFKWIADMWERDSAYRQDRRVERYARKHPSAHIIEFDGRLWIDSTHQPIVVDGVHPSLLPQLPAQFFDMTSARRMSPFESVGAKIKDDMRRRLGMAPTTLDDPGPEC